MRNGFGKNWQDFKKDNIIFLPEISVTPCLSRSQRLESNQRPAHYEWDLCDYRTFAIFFLPFLSLSIFKHLEAYYKNIICPLFLSFSILNCTPTAHPKGVTEKNSLDFFKINSHIKNKNI